MKLKLDNPEAYLDGFPKIRDTADIMVYKNGRQTSSNGVVSERISSKSIRVDS